MGSVRMEYTKDDLLIMTDYSTRPIKSGSFVFVDNPYEDQDAYYILDTGSNKRDLVISAYLRKPTQFELELYKAGVRNINLKIRTDIPDFVAYVNNTKSRHFKDFMSCLAQFKLPTALFENYVNDGAIYVGFIDSKVVSYAAYDYIPQGVGITILNKNPIVRSMIDLFEVKSSALVEEIELKTNMLVCNNHTGVRGLVKVLGNGRVSIQSSTELDIRSQTELEDDIRKGKVEVLDYNNLSPDWLLRLPMLVDVVYTHANGNIFRYKKPSAIVRKCAIYDNRKVYNPDADSLTPSSPKDVAWLEACEEVGSFVPREEVKDIVRTSEKEVEVALGTPIVWETEEENSILEPPLAVKIDQKDVPLGTKVYAEIIPIKKRK